MTPALGVYVHVPFCAVRCPYCDFNTYTTAAGRSTFAATAVKEVALAARALGDGRRVDTVFFGGGTPTLLAPEEIGAVLRAIDEDLGLARGAEITVEANPDSVGPEAFAALRALGVTRISIGMQSGAPHVLEFLGRTHAAGRAPEAAREARAAGFEHVSLDLIYGSPVEDDDDWRASLEAALAGEPDHVSVYGLTVEPGTRLNADVRRGAVPAPSQEALAERYVMAEEILTRAGLPWYEVASFASSSEARCRHNEGYWRGEDWWGIGPGAHGHVAGRRWANVKRPAAWSARVEAGESPAAEHEILDAEQRRLERLITEVRTRDGIPAGVAAPEAVRALAAEGLLEAGPQRHVLTLAGRLVADHVTRRLAG